MKNGHFLRPLVTPLPKGLVALPVGWTLFIAWMATVPGTFPEDPSPAHWPFAVIPSLLQNLAHIPVYGTLAWLWRWSLARHLAPVAATSAAFALTFATGIGDELIQSTVPGRTATLGDIGLNTIGAVLFLTVFEMLRRRLAVR